MRNLLLIAVLFLSPLVHGDTLEDILQRIEQEYSREAPDYAAIREQVSQLKKFIAQMTYPLKRRVNWWEEPADGLILKLEEIADTLAPYEEMLIDLASHEGVEHALTILMNARPSATLKVRLQNYLFGDYPRSIPRRALSTLYELGLTDDALYERLFRETMEQERYRSQDFSLLSMLASRNDPVTGFSDALLSLLGKRIAKVIGEDLRSILELSDITMSYSKMIDGMGIEMLPMALELEKLIVRTMKSPFRDEVLTAYPNFKEYTSSIIERVRKDQIRKIPPRGYGLVVIQNNSASSEPLPDVTEVIEEVAVLEPTNEEPAAIVAAEVTEEPFEQPLPAADKSNWWLWLIGMLVVVRGVVLLRSKPNGRSE